MRSENEMENYSLGNGEFFIIRLSTIKGSTRGATSKENMPSIRFRRASFQTPI